MREVRVDQCDTIFTNVFLAPTVFPVCWKIHPQWVGQKQSIIRNFAIGSGGQQRIRENFNKALRGTNTERATWIPCKDFDLF